MKAAHEEVGGAPWQEIRVAHLFRPTYAEANVGHPSDSLYLRYDTNSDAPWRKAARPNYGWAMAKANSADPAGITTYCLPSSRYVIAVE